MVSFVTRLLCFDHAATTKTLETALISELEVVL